MKELLLLLLSMPHAACASKSRPESYRVEGRVVDETGKPLAGRKLQLGRPKDIENGMDQIPHSKRDTPVDLDEKLVVTSNDGRFSEEFEYNVRSPKIFDPSMSPILLVRGGPRCDFVHLVTFPTEEIEVETLATSKPNDPDIEPDVHIKGELEKADDSKWLVTLEIKKDHSVPGCF